MAAVWQLHQVKGLVHSKFLLFLVFMLYTIILFKAWHWRDGLRSLNAVPQYSSSQMTNFCKRIQEKKNSVVSSLNPHPPRCSGYRCLLRSFVLKSTETCWSHTWNGCVHWSDADMILYHRRLLTYVNGYHQRAGRWFYHLFEIMSSNNNFNEKIL